MGLIYDNPDLAALTLTRRAAEESEGPGALEGRMVDYLDGLEQRNGTPFLELVAITLARVYFKSLDDLARAVTRMPRADALPGSLSYEPKWDGYRCVAIHDDTGVSLWSRQGKQLIRYFPELVEAIAAAVPPGCVIDGEAVIWTRRRLDFSPLQQRLGAGAKTLPGLVRDTPRTMRL